MLLCASGSEPAQTGGKGAGDRTPQIQSSYGSLFGRLVSACGPREVSPVSLQNS